MTTFDEHFDYVIAGGGTAGCVLAARLSEDPKVRVLLLEAGPPPRSLWIRMPAGMGRLFVNQRYNWGFETEAEPQLGGRTLYWPQGKTLGGSSAINGMAFVRGHHEDYDNWRDAGAEGWGWEAVRPYFQRLESRSGGNGRGASGPLSVSDPVYVHESTLAFREAACNVGLLSNPDYNGAVQEGVSLLQFTIRNGKRHSAADAYLKPALNRPNLTVRTDAAVRTIRFANGRATGVAYCHAGIECEASAVGEVILSSGAIGSPHILLSSGIGDGQALQALGINVVAHLPGVGENLIDHPYVHMTFGVRKGASLNAMLRGWRVYAQGARWLLARSGPLTIGASQAVAFVRSGVQAERPDLQINFRPISHGFESAGRPGPDTVPRVTAAICARRPSSRGRVWLRSPVPESRPAMIGRYLTERSDEDALIAGVEWARRIFTADPMKSIVVSEDKPGTATAGREAIGQFVRETVQTMCHPVGTCRMGTGSMAVVDERLRVRGVKGLRVVDSSIMPDIVSGNTVAATYMIAEKGADIIRADRTER